MVVCLLHRTFRMPAGQTPACDTVQTPSCDAVQTPACDAVQTPACDAVKTPACGAVHVSVNFCHITEASCVMQNTTLYSCL